MWWALAVLWVVQATPVAPRHSLEEALALEQQGHDDRALAAFDALSADQPAWALPRLESARLRLKLGREIDRAHLDADVARSLAPENPRAHYTYGLVREEQRAEAEAIAAYRTALALRPSLDDARLRLAGLHFARGEWGEAEEHYRLVAANRPDWPHARLQLIATLEQQGRIPAAEEELRRMYAAEPTSRLIGRRLAEFYERTGRPELGQKIRDELEPKKPAKKMRPLKKSRR